MPPTRADFWVLLVHLGLTAWPGPSVRGNPPVLRADQYGDPLPAGAVQRLGTERIKCNGEIRCVHYLPDGKTALAAGGDALSFWDTNSGRRLREMPESAASFAVSADGKWLALAQGSRISVRDLATGREYVKLSVADTYLRSVAFSADGKYLAGGGEPACVRLWDLPSGELRWKYESGHGKVWSLAFSPDGSTLAATEGQQTVVLWEPASGKELRRLQGRQPASADSPPAALAFLPDSRTLVHACGPLYLWDTHTGRVQREEAAGKLEYGCVALSRDGKLLAAGGHGVLRLWDVNPWALRHEIRGHQESVRAVTFAPDGRALLAGDSARCLRVWDPATGQDLLPLPGHTGKVMSVAFAPDGRGVATLSRGAVQLWDTGTGQRRAVLGLRRETAQGTLHFASSGQRLACANAVGPHLWQLPAGTLLELFPAEKADHSPEISSLAFSHDGKFLVAAIDDDGRDLRWWPAAGGPEVRRLDAPRRRLQGLACAPQGKTLTAVDSEQQVTVRDATSGRELHSFRLPGKPIRAVLSPDGSQVAAVYESGDVYTWRTTDGGAKRFIVGKDDEARCLTFSPDGRFLALATGYQGRAAGWGCRVCELLTGQEVCRFSGHQGELRDLAFSADSRLLASASDDCTVLIWDTLPGLLPVAVLADADRADCWQELGTSASRAYRAGGMLATDARATVAFLAERLRQIPLVRTEQLSPLIADLNGERFAVRESAEQQLAAWGEAVVPALRQALLGKVSLEARRRIEQLLDRTAEATHAPDWLRQQRGIALLEKIDTAEARALLQALSRGLPEAQTTRHAEESLARLVGRSNTPTK